METRLDFIVDNVSLKLGHKDSGSSSECTPLLLLAILDREEQLSPILMRHLPACEYAETEALERHAIQPERELRESVTSRLFCLGIHTFVIGISSTANELDKMLGRIQPHRPHIPQGRLC